MDYIKINKLITTSIYKQIASSISKSIETGQLKYGDKLPTEKEICQAFSISHTVVKMAYEELIKEGLIKRIKGKGTYVTNRSTYKTDLRKFYELDTSSNPDYITQVIMQERIYNDYSAYRAMKLDNGDKCYKMMTVTKKGENPVLVQTVYFPYKYYPNFTKCYLDYHRLFEFIESDCNQIRIKNLHSTFKAMNANNEAALLLNLKPDDAISFIRTKIIDVNDHIVAYVRSYFPGSFTEFEVIVRAV